MPSDKTSPALARRQSPTQKRGIETYNRILDATAALLDEEGFEALTTNHIAERAHTNIATLYKYFPNKYAVIQAFAERDQTRQHEIIGRALSGAEDWHEALDRGLDAFMQFLVSEPGGIGLNHAIRTSPALRPLAEEAQKTVVRVLVERLPVMGLSGSRQEVEAAAHVIYEAASAVLIAAREVGPASRKRMMRELKLLLTCYIEARRT